MQLKKNDRATLEITGMTSEGYGVGRTDSGQVVFVPNTAPGDRAEVLIVKVLKKYCYGRLARLLTPSSSREQNECPVFEKCGGCAYRHIRYSSEVSLKTEQVFHNLKAIGKVEFTAENAVCDPLRIDRYRNKGQYPAGKTPDGKTVFGFYAPHSHRLVPISDCLLQPKIFGKILAEIGRFSDDFQISVYDEATGTGLLRHVFLRQGTISGEIMVCFVVNANAFTGEAEVCRRLTDKFPQIKSIVLNENRRRDNVILGECCRTLWGLDTIEDVLCGLSVKLSPLSFYQVNHDMAQRLYTLALELAKPRGDERLLDLYCGAGLIGLSMARHVREVVGVEVVEQAVKNARQNAENNQIQNARFLCGDASLIGRLVTEEKEQFDIAVVDPPRRGCDIAVIEALEQSGAEKIVMISCNSATLARDVALLSERGYSVQQVIPVDLFPRTVHVECVTLLSKSK